MNELRVQHRRNTAADAQDAEKPQGHSIEASDQIRVKAAADRSRFSARHWAGLAPVGRQPSLVWIPEDDGMWP